MVSLCIFVPWGISASLVSLNMISTLKFLTFHSALSLSPELQTVYSVASLIAHCISTWDLQLEWTPDLSPCQFVATLSFQLLRPKIFNSSLILLGQAYYKSYWFYLQNISCVLLFTHITTTWSKPTSPLPGWYSLLTGLQASTVVFPPKACSQYHSQNVTKWCQTQVKSCHLAALCFTQNKSQSWSTGNRALQGFVPCFLPGLFHHFSAPNTSHG